MGLSEKVSEFQARYRVFTSNARSRKINKNLPPLAPRPEEQAPGKSNRADAWMLISGEGAISQQNSDFASSLVDVTYSGSVTNLLLQDPIIRTQTCPIPADLSDGPANIQIERRMSRKRESEYHGGLRTKQQRHSMPARSRPLNLEPSSGFQIFGMRDHQRSNSHDNQYPMSSRFDTPNSSVEVQNWSMGLVGPLSSPSSYDLGISEDLDFQDWHPTRLGKINSVDSSILEDMADSGFISWPDEIDMQANFRDLANYSTPQSLVGSPVFPLISSDCFGDIQTNFEREKSLQFLEGMTSDLLAIEAGSDDQPFSPNWSWNQPAKQKQVMEPLQLQERTLQIRKKKSAPLQPLFSCPQCTKYNGEKAFKRKDHLDQHLKTAHHMAPQDLFPAFCKYSWCEKSEANQAGVRAFQTSKDFTDHLKNAHDESLFNCEFPGCTRKGKKGYSGKANLINHQRKVHNRVGDSTKTESAIGNTI